MVTCKDCGACVYEFNKDVKFSAKYGCYLCKKCLKKRNEKKCEN